MSKVFATLTHHIRAKPILRPMIIVIFFVANLNAFAAPNAASGREYWQGEEKCDTLFETALPNLPGGSYLTKIMGDSTIRADYALKSGGVVSVSVLDVKKIPVNGLNYDAAHADLITRKPLQDRLARKVEARVVLADVRTIISNSFLMKKTTDKTTGITTYTIRPQSLRLNVKAKVRVADWTEYALADDLSQKKWNRHQCTSYHHELGHILVTAQILEESQSEWLNLRATSVDDFGELHDKLMSDVEERVQDRQAAYHAALKEMGPSIGRSRPYLELHFGWLKQSPDIIDGELPHTP